MTRSNHSRNRGIAAIALTNIDLDQSPHADLPGHRQDVPDVRSVPSRTQATDSYAKPTQNEPPVRIGSSPAAKVAAVRQPARLSNASSVPRAIARMAA